MGVAVVGWRLAERGATDAAEQLAAAEQGSAQRTQELRAATAATVDAEARAEVLRALVQPGMADQLEAVHLQVATAACADPEAPAAAVIEQVSAEASAGSEMLASHPGWEQVIAPDAVEQARANCDG